MLQIAAMALTKPTFPAPDHDHDRCAADGIDHAERVCAQRAQKFTPIRRQVLQALLSSHRPLGAYEVIDKLAKSMPRPAPITVSSTALKAAMRISPAPMTMTPRRWWRF
jgi:Fur family zinc uptake transcriptional regulator